MMWWHNVQVSWWICSYSCCCRKGAQLAGKCDSNFLFSLFAIISFRCASQFCISQADISSLFCIKSSRWAVLLPEYFFFKFLQSHSSHCCKPAVVFLANHFLGNFFERFLYLQRHLLLLEGKSSKTPCREVHRLISEFICFDFLVQSF